MAESNFYFETLNKTEGELTDDVIVGRMNECSAIINEITQNHVWLTILRDSRDMIKKLDDSWQDFQPDSKQIQEARVLKMAHKHIFDLPMKYAHELDQLQEELHKRQNSTENIQKDNDNEI